MSAVLSPSVSTASGAAETHRTDDGLRHDWRHDEVQALFDLPFNDLLFQAHTVHRQHHEPNTVQLATLLSIKTGACPEDCAYCPQSVRYETGLKKEPLLPLDAVVEAAKEAKANGATRFCMGAAWRSPKDRDIERVEAMVRAVKDMGLETCVTLGMLKPAQAQRLADAGLDYYNHNLDTSPEFYGKIISTRTYEDRLQTLDNVREAGIKVCCGGIVGMGEQEQDRAELLRQLANLDVHPESVPINNLVQVEGTPLQGQDEVHPIDFVKMIAVARVLMPKSQVRLSAGRQQMSEEMQALCFFAGANSIFYGERLLTTENPQNAKDRALIARLGMRTEGRVETADPCAHEHGRGPEHGHAQGGCNAAACAHG
ncbi:biotin synthase BioB [Solimonas variicoloris]|uniref:biotin synthase BioB n=1 Tax=Solimonas variicoloris TaxID=254408 RepID=UPI00035E015A